jgi:hypothetical protein
MKKPLKKEINCTAMIRPFLVNTKILSIEKNREDLFLTTSSILNFLKLKRMKQSNFNAYDESPNAKPYEPSEHTSGTPVPIQNLRSTDVANNESKSKLPPPHLKVTNGRVTEIPYYIRSADVNLQESSIY